jgi:uncharacterized protein YjcR
MDDKSPEPTQTQPEGHIEAVIRELYLGKRHSDQEIAEALGVNRVTVTKWRKRWGIARDDRGPVEISA